jgi:predicted MPP superfamily phosphohydrolase
VVPPVIPYALDFTLILAASIALDIAIALALLSIPLGKIGRVDWRERITLGRCIFAAAIVGLCSAPKCIAASVIGVHLFGFMNLLYCTAAFAAPTIGILVLSIPSLRRRLTRPARVFACASLTAIPMFIYCSIIEPSRIVFEHHTVPIAGVTEPITVVVLADIQCSRITQRERDIADRVNALNPDLILIPGDLWQDRGSLGFEPLEDEVATEFRDFLRSLRAKHGVFFAPGNAEDGYDWRPLVESAGVIALENETTSAWIGTQDVMITGTEWRSYTLATQDTLAAADEAPPTSLTIVMSHTPDVILGDSSDRNSVRGFSGIDLIISGHTHGGQVQLPGLGPLITFSSAPRHICAGGLFPLDADTHICVSRGIGMERGQAPRLRFLCPPEVTVLTIAPLSP